MTIEAISDLPVSDLATRDAHLYLWTMNRYLREAYYVAEAWGFAPITPLIWCKEPMGLHGAARSPHAPSSRCSVGGVCSGI